MTRWGSSGQDRRGDVLETAKFMNWGLGVVRMCRTTNVSCRKEKGGREFSSWLNMSSQVIGAGICLLKLELGSQKHVPLPQLTGR